MARTRARRERCFIGLECSSDEQDVKVQQICHLLEGSTDANALLYQIVCSPEFRRGPYRLRVVVKSLTDGCLKSRSLTRSREIHLTSECKPCELSRICEETHILPQQGDRVAAK